MAKKKADLSFDFGANRKPRRRPTGKRTPAQQAGYALYFGKKGGKK